MVLLDSNIIIYASKKEHNFLLDYFKSRELAASVISKIEVMGYHLIQKSEKKLLSLLFESFILFPVDERCIQTAIEVRTKYNLSLGDSIIAATSLNNKLELVTRNAKDFEKIKSLKVTNPFNN